MRRLLALASVFAVVVVAPAAEPPIEGKTGLKVGEKAPAFKLKDQDGKERTLEEFTKKGMVALVFHRSAGW
jgi:cytochrome oxidase Cu insertion factor (SCO1/SenC/PrrC family)